MKHYTTDLGTQAQDIAQREADKVWKETHSLTAYMKVFKETLQSFLREAQDPLTSENE